MKKYFLLYFICFSFEVTQALKNAVLGIKKMPFKKFLLKSIHLGSWIGLHFWLPLLLFFCCVSFAELSDDEKIKFIERIAKKFPETQTFYRWQDETARTIMLQAGELTPQLYDYFQNKEVSKKDSVAGKGVYVAEDIASASRFGDKLMKVEVEKGVSYIDLSDSETISTLKAQGITREDVYDLSPKVAVKYQNVNNNNSSWWNLKGNEGIKFEKVDVSGMSLSELKEILQPVVYPIGNSRPVFQLLDDTPQIKDQIKILEALKPPSKDFGEYLLTRGFLNKNIEEMRTVVNGIIHSDQTEKLPQSIYNIFTELHTNASSEMKDLAKEIQAATTDQQKNKMVEKALDKIRTPEEVHLFLASMPPQSSLQEAVVKAGLRYIQSAQSGAFLLKGIKDPSLIQHITKETIPHIQSAQDGTFLLEQIEDPVLKRQVTLEVIPHIQSAQDGIFLLEQIEDPELKRQVTQAAISHIQSAQDGTFLLEKIEDSTLKRQITQAAISHIQSTQDGVFLLGKIENPALKKQITLEVIPHIQSAQDGALLLRNIPQNSEYREKILKDSMAKTQSARDGLHLLNLLKPGSKRNELVELITSKINSIRDLPDVVSLSLSNSEKKMMIERGISVMQDINDVSDMIEQILEIEGENSTNRLASVFDKGIIQISTINDWRRLDDMVAYSSVPQQKRNLLRNKVLEKILSIVKTVDDFSQLLEKYDVQSDQIHLNKVISAASSRFQSVDELLGVLKNVRSISKEEVIKIMAASLPDPTIITEQDLRKHDLFVSNYKDIVSSEQEKRKKGPTISNTPVDINCLKKELGAS